MKVLWHSHAPTSKTGIGVMSKRTTFRLVKGTHPVFCPVCNKGRKNPLRNSILSPTDIKDITRCSCCKRLFVGRKEVQVEVTEKPKPGQDLRKMIPDWYRCPECMKVVAGFGSWASHTVKEHDMHYLAFERKYGKPEKSYYGLGFDKYFNPSER